MIHTKKSLSGRLYAYSRILPLILALCTGARPVKAGPPPSVQEKNPAPKVRPAVPQELKVFEGYYQFTEDKNTYLQILVKENQLVLKQLWDNQEIPFKQRSELEFFCEEKNFPLKFTKNSEGAITQVLAFDKDVWNKVKDYKPVVRKETKLSPQELKAFEGKYTFQFQPGEDSFIQITVTGNGLTLKQGWDGKEIQFVPETATEFFCKEQNFPLKFTKDPSGAVTQVLAFNRDLWNRVK